MLCKKFSEYPGTTFTLLDHGGVFKLLKTLKADFIPNWTLYKKSLNINF